MTTRSDTPFTRTVGRLGSVQLLQTSNSGGTLTSYQDCRYYFDVSQSGFGHDWVRQVKNTWNWLNQYGYAQSSVLVQNDYTYDNGGNRLTNQLSDQNGVIRTEQYGYDALSRLTSVNYGDGQTQGYTFDPMGHRLTKTDSANGNDTYTYNNANMLLTRNSGSYTNDLNGNTLTGGGRSNTWDGLNRLTQVVYNGTTTTHTYGADGLRRRTVQGANTTDYLLDGQSVVRTKLNGNVDKTYLHGARGPEYERTGSNAPGWYVYDGLGSVLGITDSSGNFTSTRKYDVYGAVRASTGSNGTKHKFVGQLGHPSEDETGLPRHVKAKPVDFAVEVNPMDVLEIGSDRVLYSSNAENFRGHDFSRKLLPLADLRNRDLSGADFTKANLSGADLRGATLVQTRMEGTNLRGANLDQADLTQAVLTGSILRGASLRNSNLSGALLGSSLVRTDFELSDLRGARIIGAHLANVSFRFAHLEGAVFTNSWCGDEVLWTEGFDPTIAGLRIPGDCRDHIESRAPSREMVIQRILLLLQDAAFACRDLQHLESSSDVGTYIRLPSIPLPPLGSHRDDHQDLTELKNWLAQARSSLHETTEILGSFREGDISVREIEGDLDRLKRRVFSLLDS